MVIIFTGPPLAGKGTQAHLLSKKLNLPVFSIGQLLRQSRESGNEKMKQAYETYSMQGKHLPISIKFNLLKEKMDQPKDGFILENFPATKEDLGIFLRYLQEKQLRVDKVFLINLSEEEMLKRMELRGRIDDTKEVVLKRRRIQDNDRIPVIDYFIKEGILVELRGEEAIGTVHHKICEAMGI